MTGSASPHPSGTDAPKIGHTRPDLALEEVDSHLAAEWDQLAVSTGAGAFSRPGWLMAWAGAFAEGRLQCITARGDGSLVGILPVVARGGRMHSPTNAETHRFRPVLARPTDFADMVSTVARRGRRISLSFLPADDPSLAALSAHAGTGSVWLRREIRRSPYVRTEGDFGAWERARLSRDRYQNLRRLERRLGEQGDVTFEVLTGGTGLTALLHEGFAVEAAGWKGEAGTAVLHRAAALRFYTDAAEWAASQGILRLFFLRLDGKAIAFALSLQEGSVVSGIKFGFDERYRKYGPGVLLLRRRLQYCFAEPVVTRFDFLGESERYKMEWADSTELQLQVEIFGAGTAGLLSRSAVASAWRARKEARQRIPLEVRERLDLSSPLAAWRSLASLSRTPGVTRSLLPSTQAGQRRLARRRRVAATASR